jgi:hypothetical protein
MINRNYLTKSYSLHITDNKFANTGVYDFTCLSHLFQFIDFLKLKYELNKLDSSLLEQSKKDFFKNLQGFSFSLTDGVLLFANQLETIVSKDRVPNYPEFTPVDEYDFTPYLLCDFYSIDSEDIKNDREIVAVNTRISCPLGEVIEILNGDLSESMAKDCTQKYRELITRVEDLDFENQTIVEAIQPFFYKIKLK